jgi:hypothetical protein
VNLAYPVGIHCPGCGMAVGWVVAKLFKYPAIGIPVGILLICALIVVVVCIVRRRRASKRMAGTAQVLEWKSLDVHSVRRHRRMVTS